jgi:hypothetical protein
MKATHMFEDELAEPVTAKEGQIVFVTIGVPCSNIPIMQKVRLYVEPTTDTPVTAAKKLRKMVADNIENHGWVVGTKFTPAELYYEIYYAVDSTVPNFCSDNARYLRRKV